MTYASNHEINPWFWSWLIEQRIRVIEYDLVVDLAGRFKVSGYFVHGGGGGLRFGKIKLCFAILKIKQKILWSRSSAWGGVSFYRENPSACSPGL
jgi:hypothetical protein